MAGRLHESKFRREEIAMRDKKNQGKPQKQAVVTWVHRQHEGAEDEFWRLYLKLGLEAVLDAVNKREQEDGHDQA
jgi:hypothetical protein